MEERTARVRSTEVLAGGVRRLDFEAVEPQALSFRGGQFVSIRIADGYHPRRSYSVASSAARSDGFELLIGGSGAAAGGFFAELAVGDEIRFNGPMGFFTIADEHAGDVVLAVTGVGVSAILSQLHDLVNRPEPGKLELYWGFTNREELFGDELLAPLRENPRFTCHRYLATPDDAWTERTGFITDDVVATADALTEPTYYLCGNFVMVQSVRASLAAKGLPVARVRTEMYYPRVG